MMKTMVEIIKEYNVVMGKLKRQKIKENFGQKELRLFNDFIGNINDYNRGDRNDINTLLSAINYYIDNKTY